MLALDRKQGESIVIVCPHGERITISVAKIRPRNYVRIGIDAPKDYAVNRSEIQNRIDSGVER